MKTIKCIIVDDEPLAIDVIVNYLNRLSHFDIVGTFTNPLDAFTSLKNQKIDLLFLDIEMEELNGLDLIKSLSNKPNVIVTTAYREFAVEGFELNILDYLVKPIEFERFMIAIDRLIESRIEIDIETKEFIMVRADRKFVKVVLSDILYVEGIKDYVKINLEEGMILTKVSIGNFADELPENQFLRIHKSFIVSLDKVTAYTHQDVEIGDLELPIGRVYKDRVLAKIDKK